MSRILGISGSLRKGSFNSALLRAAAEVAPQETQIEIASIAGIPLYNGDDEAEHGTPDVVTTLKDQIIAADGLLLVTPEYNNSMPGVFKNAIDWATRPPKDTARVFANKPVGLIGATPGMGGTRFAQTAWLPVFRTLGMRAWFGKQLYLGGAGQVFDAEGKLVDEKIKRLLTEYMAGFAAFVAAKGN
jgi:chromate reductase